MRKHSVMVGASLFFAMIGLGVAHADQSCVGLLALKHQQAFNSGSNWSIEMTVHREDVVGFVEYSSGWLHGDTNDNGFTGGANQLFSDRTAGNQPFNINAADQLDLTLSASGVLTIHYNPWNFTTTWDLSCSGPLVTKRVPGVGVVTIAFRQLSPIIW